MPDIVRDGSDEMLLWLDELCNTCDNTGTCPLLKAIRDLDLMTYGGCHVASCKRYEGDPVMTLDTELEDAIPTNTATSLQEIEKLRKELDVAVSAMDELVDTHG